MKQYFIEQRHLPSLTLFFAGWGMDERPFLHYHPADRDLLVCYDYRSLDFDFSLPEGYEDIRVVGWSMCGPLPKFWTVLVFPLQKVWR